MIRINRQLTEVYEKSRERQTDRYERIQKVFSDLYDTHLQFAVRIPAILKIPFDQLNLGAFEQVAVALENDIVIACCRTEDKVLTLNSSCKTKYPAVSLTKESSVLYDENRHRNIVVCAAKVLLSFGFTNTFDGLKLFVDSTIPSHNKMNTTLSIILGIVIAGMAEGTDLQGKSGALKYPFDKIVERILLKYEKINDDDAFDRESAQLSLMACCQLEKGCVFSKLPDGSYFSKPIDQPYKLMLLQVVGGSSKTKEKVRRIKMLIEWRLFLHSIGIDYNKHKKVKDIIDSTQYSIEEMKQLVSDNFENKEYLIKAVEESMNLSIVSLLNDIPFAMTSIDSIFCIEPFKTSMAVLDMGAASNPDPFLMLNEYSPVVDQYFPEVSPVEKLLNESVRQYAKMRLNRYVMVVVDDDDEQFALLRSFYTDHIDDLLMFEDLHDACIYSQIDGGLTIVQHQLQ